MPENTGNMANVANTPQTAAAPTKCVEPRCTSYRPGHRVHIIQAQLVAQTPWGWRDAVLRGMQSGWLHLSYLDAEAHPRIWSHTALTDVLCPGAPVRLHEQFHVLGSPAGWFNVVHRDGSGAVPAPAHPSLWHAEPRRAAVDNHTGRALPLDHLRPGAAG
ncbi:hypothetical protein [Ruania zhangjianzhongii]|uniref:hypothetical protein n=1 Tax=Ruania zhangjianzhongii TaxID=2603206 RepID=UPI0011CAD944|nr:hypothetical protein [Ruania zhangjianzhongii]